MKKKSKRIADDLRNNMPETFDQMIADEIKGRRFEVYTDGSHSDNASGCAWVILYKGVVYKTGRKKLSPNIDSVEAEIRAVTHALSDCPSFYSLDVYIDCQVAIKKLQKTKLNVKRQVVRLHWLKAHQGNIYNELADYLARRSCD
jgi:ribonuclease HI